MVLGLALGGSGGFLLFDQSLLLVGQLTLDLPVKL